MVNKKPRIVIIGAGMAGLTAANKLYTFPNSTQLFELLVVEGGSRIGGRINSSEFCGDRIEQGATWIHGIGGSPIYNIAQEINSLQSQQPWECMDKVSEDPVTIAEGGYEISPFLVEPISTLYNNLMDFCQGNTIDEDGDEILKLCTDNGSVGSFLKQGIEAYWSTKDQNGMKKVGTWNRKSLEEAIFAIYESMQRTDTGAEDLCTLDYNAESEYIMFPGEEITIAKGYLSVIESLASVLPVNTIQFDRIVEKIEWHSSQELHESINNRPVKLYFNDGSIISADHVIVTVSLGVLKQGIQKDSGMFNPPLPNSKTSAISRLGYGLVNKVFLQTSNSNNQEEEATKFPFLQMAFHQTGSLQKTPKLPEWIRRTSSIKPIYSNSRVVLSWFTGKEAIELESMSEEEIRKGFSTTISHFLPSNELKIGKVLRTQWGTNPLFLGSYSFIAVGSNIDDMDTLAEPLPSPENTNTPALQILFAGEATHRTHYSTTHGAYFSGLREANRLLKHIN